MGTKRIISASLLEPELVFTTSRSSGPGGQNVNKVNSKVTVQFDIPHSKILTDEEKATLQLKLATHLTKEGILLLSSQDKRSQLQNKDVVLQKFNKTMAKAFVKRKARKATKPSKNSVQQRLTKKKLHGEKKKWRQAI